MGHIRVPSTLRNKLKQVRNFNSDMELNMKIRNKELKALESLASLPSFHVLFIFKIVGQIPVQFWLQNDNHLRASHITNCVSPKLTHCFSSMVKTGYQDIKIRVIKLSSGFTRTLPYKHSKYLIQIPL